MAGALPPVCERRAATIRERSTDIPPAGAATRVTPAVTPAEGEALDKDRMARPVARRGELARPHREPALPPRRQQHQEQPPGLRDHGWLTSRACEAPFPRSHHARDRACAETTPDRSGQLPIPIIDAGPQRLEPRQESAHQRQRATNRRHRSPRDWPSSDVEEVFSEVVRVRSPLSSANRCLHRFSPWFARRSTGDPVSRAVWLRVAVPIAAKLSPGTSRR